MIRSIWPGAALIVAAILLGIAVSAGLGSGPDLMLERLLAMRAGVAPNWAIAIARGITRLGDPGFRSLLLLIVVIYLVTRKRIWAAVVLAVTIGIGTTADSVLKEIFARPRPMVVPHLDLVDSYAYPSGHAANSALILLSAAALISGKRRWPLVLAATLVLAIGVTRILLGVHWPSDVLGGWMFGAGCAMTGVWALGSGKMPARSA